MLRKKERAGGRQGREKGEKSEGVVFVCERERGGGGVGSEVRGVGRFQKAYVQVLRSEHETWEQMKRHFY